MGERPKKIASPDELPHFESWEDLSRAIRETGNAIVAAMREAFGPQQRIVMKHDEAPKLLDQIRPVVVEATAEEAADPLTMKAKLHHTLKVRVRDDLLTLCGFEDGAETTADGSAENDLAHERADAVMSFLGLIQRHNLPGKLLPKRDPLEAGTRVVVYNQHRGRVVPRRDTVSVQIESPGWPHPVEFPRGIVQKER